jgi:hypothetical protein
MNDELFTHDHFRFSSPPSRPSREINLCSTTVKSRSEKSERQLNFGLKPALSMNLDFNGTRLVPMHMLHSELVVTTALILTFSPWRRDSDCMRLFMRWCVGRIQSRMLGGSGGSMREIFGEISPRRGRNGFRCSHQSYE